MQEDSYEIAVVNSSTFGSYFPDLMEKLENIGTVERYDFFQK